MRKSLQRHPPRAHICLARPRKLFLLLQFWFQFDCGFSAQSAFQSWIVSLYNVVFTSLPVLSLGIFEQDVGKKYSLQHPELYVLGQKVGWEVLGVHPSGRQRA